MIRPIEGEFEVSIANDPLDAWKGAAKWVQDSKTTIANSFISRKEYEDGIFLKKTTCSNYH